MTNGNLAYKYDYREKEEKNEQVNKKKKVSSKRNEISYFAKLAAILVTSLSALFMIVQFIEVNEVQSALGDIRSEYEFESALTSQKAFELEQSIDLSKIEQEATARLGMHRPERHQIVYIDVKNSDMTVKTADEVEGIGNRISDMFDTLMGNIVSFFSI